MEQFCFESDAERQDWKQAFQLAVGNGMAFPVNIADEYVLALRARVAPSFIYDIHLIGVGGKIPAIKALREIVSPQLGLKQAKEFTDLCPVIVPAGIMQNGKARAEQLLSDSGATFKLLKR